MNEKKICPICGSEKLEFTTIKEIFHGDMDKKFEIDKKKVKCMECDSEGDFFNENEDGMNNALSKLSETYINEALDYFNDKKISYAGIERAVGLPQRTLTKWKNEISTPTAAGIALLKYLRTFPWLIEVAEHKFNYDISQKIFLEVAFNTLINSIQFKSSGFVPDGYSNTVMKLIANINTGNIQFTENNFTFNIS